MPSFLWICYMPVIDGPKPSMRSGKSRKDHGLTGESCCKIILRPCWEDGEDTHNAMYLGRATSFLQKPWMKKSILCRTHPPGRDHPGSRGLSAVAPGPAGEPANRALTERTVAAACVV
jgi:hypothetical protein